METVSYLNVGGTDYELADKQARIDMALKADKTALEKVASGSPAGVYDSLLSLQSAEGTDKTKIYITTDNGNWNYWNGSTWVSGGVYQATQIEINSLSPNLMTFFNAVGNLLKTTSIIEGKNFDDTGNIVENETTFITDYIKVKPSTIYKVFSLNCVLYNSNKNKIKTITPPDGSLVFTFTTTEDTTYIRTSGGIEAIENNSLFVFEGLKDSDKFKDIKGHSLNDEILVKIDNTNLNDKVVGYNKTDFINRYGNLLKSSSYIRNKYLKDDGSIIDGSDDDFVTDYILVEPNTTYKIFAYNVNLYNKNKEFLQAVEHSGTIFTFTTTEDTLYIRTSGAITALENGSLYLLKENDNNKNQRIYIDKNIKIDDRYFLDLKINMPKLAEGKNTRDFGDIGNKCYFLGRWIKTDNGMYTTLAGAKIFTRVKNTSTVAFDFSDTTNYMLRFAYKVDNNDYVVIEDSTSFTISDLDKNIEHYIEVVITSMNTATFSSNNGVYLKDITVDANGEVVAVKPKCRIGLCFGDSITEGWNVNNDNNNSYHLNFLSQISKFLKCEFISIGRGGIGYITKSNSDWLPVKGTEGEETAYNADCSYIDCFNSSNKYIDENVDFILIELGTNDNVTDLESYKLIVKNCVNRIKNKYPGRIIVGLIPLNGKNKEILTEAYEEINIIIIDCSKYLVSTTDNVHPDLQGSINFGYCLSEDLLNIFGKSYFLI
ncbi:hypothetical protein [Megamonas funiformis]|uniref:hypothetical protein n=1 Tax=Megamonas funiformis TaxID=437897 RepID=UPI003F7E38F2